MGSHTVNTRKLALYFTLVWDFVLVAG